MVSKKNDGTLLFCQKSPAGISLGNRQAFVTVVGLCKQVAEAQSSRSASCKSKVVDMKKRTTADNSNRPVFQLAVQLACSNELTLLGCTTRLVYRSPTGEG